MITGRRLPRAAAACAVLGLALSVIARPDAGADTDPPEGVPATVSSDVLGTAQVNGVVWAQAISGNTVYATGEFTRARPAGAAPGTSELVRQSLLAYDIRTGELLPFRPALNGAGRALAVSPDRKRLYVGGDFTKVGATTRSRIAAFDLTTGKLVGSFRKGVDGSVRALTATNTTVYAGGYFNRAAGQPRGRVAAFSAKGALSSWKPTADRVVRALVMTPDRRKVVLGGSFSTINGRTYHGLAAVSAGTGKPLPWASRSDTFPIRSDGTSSGITSLSADASRIYLTSYNFGGRGTPGRFEGRAAISPVDGSLLWVNDCHGDSYSAVPIGEVLYSVGHAHGCEPAGAFPEQSPRQYQRALAETTYPTGKNGPATGGYASFEGLPASTQLVWYPSVNAGTFTGQSQGGWSIVGNRRYIAMGGEFTLVNNVPQQGLARFAVASLAPNARGPRSYPDFGVTASPADATGTIAVSWTGTWDPDNAVLTYRLYRGGDTTPIHTTTADSRWWLLPTLTFDDTGFAVGATQAYRLEVSDSFGNTVTTRTRPSAPRARIASDPTDSLPTPRS